MTGYQSKKTAANAKLNDELAMESYKMAETMHDIQIYQQVWVGLTRQEFNECVAGLEDLEDCWIALEAKLKEKNNG